MYLCHRFICYERMRGKKGKNWNKKKIIEHDTALREGTKSKNTEEEKKTVNHSIRSSNGARIPTKVAVFFAKTFVGQR